MSTPLKWTITFIFAFIVIVVIGFAATVQNSAVRTTGEIETLAESLSVGLIRSEIETTNDGYPYFNKDEVIANLIANVANVQKKHRYDIDLQYVFLDKNGNITTNDAEMRGVQFIVQYIDAEGTIKASAERRLTFHNLN